MKKLKIILLAIFFILLFGLFSNSKVSAYVGINDCSVYLYNRPTRECKNDNHDSDCLRYEFEHNLTGEKYYVHIGGSTNLEADNKDENIPQITSWGVFCMQHDRDGDTVRGAGSKLRYIVSIAGTSVSVSKWDAFAGGTYNKVGCAAQIAYAMTKYQEEVDAEKARLD